MKTQALFLRTWHVLALTLLSTSINLTSLTQVWVPTQDWYLEWARNSNAGRTIYSDFFVPFPPLYVDLYRLLLVFSDPLLASRVFNLIVFVLLTISLFCIAQVYASRNISLVIAVILAMTIAIDPTNTISGYWEFATMLSTWGVYFYLKGASTRNYVLSGVLVAAASLVKQNFVLVVMALVIYELIRLIYAKHQTPKSPNAHLMGFTYSALTVYAIFSARLLVEGNFRAFLEAMLSGGGKRLDFQNLINNLTAELRNPNTFVVLSLLFLILVLSSRRLLKNSHPRMLLISKAFLLTSGILLFTHTALPLIGIPGKLALSTSIMAVLYALNRSDFGFRTTNIEPNSLRVSLFSASNPSPWILGLAAVPISVISTWLISNSPISFIESFWVALVACDPFFLSIWVQSQQVLWVLVLAALGWEFLSWRSEKKAEHTLKPTPAVASPHTAVVVSLILSLLINSFNGSTALVSNLTLAAICFSWASSRLMRRGQQGELKALFSFGLICVVIASPIMTINTYRWYGWDEIKTPNVVNDLPPFKNFNLTMQETKFFAQVTELLADAKTKGQISNNARAMQFPNQPILYQVAGIEPADMHCPISWYDICPDRILELDYLTVTKDTIEVVMYYSLDPQEEESLNSFYRPGKTSVLSDIERYLKLSGRYRLAAKIPVPTAGNADLNVYFLNKGEK